MKHSIPHDEHRVRRRVRGRRRCTLGALVVIAVSAVVFVSFRQPSVHIAVASRAPDAHPCNPGSPVVAPLLGVVHAVEPSPRDAPRVVAPDPNFIGTCNTAVITTAHVNEEIAAINNARRSEGLAMVKINAARFGHLSGREQVLVVTNLERIARHMTPVAALTTELDTEAANGTERSSDPTLHGWTLVGGKYVTAWASNWAGDLDALGADYIFMYDDSVGYNLNCPTIGASGCWAHRRNVLIAAPRGSICTGHGGRPELVMGAAVLPTSYKGRVGIGELFVTSCGGLPADTTFTWTSAQHELLAAPK